MTQSLLDDLPQRIAVAIGRQDWRAAQQATIEARAAHPEAEAGWLHGSIVSLMSGDTGRALELIEERLRTHDATMTLLLQQAECLLAAGRRDDALTAAHAAVGLARSQPAALDAVGLFLTHANAHAAAAAVYDQAIDAAPTDLMLRGRRATLRRFLGRFAESAEDFDAILAQSPHDAAALKARVELERGAVDAGLIERMREALQVPGLNEEQAITLHFALAQAEESRGGHEASWRHLEAGNDLHRRRLRYEPSLDQAVVEALIEAFPSAEPLPAGASAEAPIFIVGLPRTGTTLVERILGSHSAVHAAGELPALSEALSAALAPRMSVSTLDPVSFIHEIAALDGRTVAREYLARAAAWRGTRPRFTDKQPTNFYYCALILRAFPQARIVHLTRHPLGALHAIYKTRFPRTYPFAYRIDELTDYYIGYRRLMAHWRHTAPGRILDVAYEDVVTSLEPTTRRLLDFCGLPFEDACLGFHANPAASTTASAVQVRQPLYESSLHLWRHYATQLAPARARLEAAGISVP